MKTVIVPSASDVLPLFAGGKLGSAPLFELVSSMHPADAEELGSWSGT